MTMKNLRRVALMGSTAVLAASLSSGYAQAQDDKDEEIIEEVIVTGSLIRNPNLTRSAPVAVVGQEEMDFQGANLIEEILREIPGMVPSIGAQVNNGNGGFSYVNLRGLGSNRNIVLVDGRRMSPSELNGRFDLNNIPIAVLERSEVLTGGASTTYGADALGGVVNFITKKNFTGVEVNASYGTTEQGDGDTKRFEVTMGGDFADGKGNAVLSIGYQTADPVLQGDRKFSEFVHFYTNGARGGSGLGSFNSRFGQVNPTGENHWTTDLPDGQDALRNNLSLGGVQDDRTFASAFTPFNYAPFNLYQTPFKRYNIYASADYEISDSVEMYTTGMFSKNTVNTIIAPSGSFGDSVQIALNHPFLSDAQRNAFCQFDTDSGQAYTPLFSQTECDAAATATDASDPNYRQVTTSQLNRRNVEGGPRISDYSATYFNYSLGFRGDVNEDMSWDIYASYGQSDQTQRQQGYWLKSRFRNSLLNCPTTSDGCIPVDFFGPTGSITQEMIDYLQGGESAITTRFDLGQVAGNLSGVIDFSTPWADDNLNFALGAEYRSYSGSQASDLLSQSGDLGGAGGAAPNISGGYSVFEAVAEINLPLVQGAEWAKELSFEAGMRYSNYSIDAEDADSFVTTTWKTGLSWAPIDDLTFRATFSRAVRAPNVSELFAPVTAGLTNLSIDPCASVDDEGNPIGNTPTGALRDVCIAQGAPAGAIGSIPLPAAGQANSIGGGNIDLLPEESDSWTLGIIYQPEYIPGLTVTADYYNIKVDGAINAPNPTDVLDACFDAPSTSNPACLAIGRSPIDGSLSGDEATVSGLPLGLSNSGNLATDGVDLTVTYSRPIGELMWTSRFAGNWTNKSTFQAVTGVSFNRDCVGLYSGNCASIQPEVSFNWRNTISYEKFDVSLNWRFISENEYENRRVARAFNGELEGGELGSWNFNRTKPYNLFDMTVRYNIMENITLTGTISNLFDKQPPLTGSFIGATGFNSGNTYPSTFDTLGRRFNIAARVKF